MGKEVGVDNGLVKEVESIVENTRADVMNQEDNIFL